MKSSMYNKEHDRIIKEMRRTIKNLQNETNLIKRYTYAETLQELSGEMTYLIYRKVLKA